MGGIVPGGWDIGEFGDGGKDHNESRDRTAEGNSRPSHGSRGRGFITWGVYLRGVVRRVKVKDGYVKNPDAVEVDEEMGNGPFFKICFEKNAIPFYFAEFHETLGRWDVDQTGLGERLCKGMEMVEDNTHYQ
jgi:hypothetical protein